MRDIILIGTTSTGGAKTVISPETVQGFLYKVKWVDGDLVDAVTAVLSVIETPEGVDEILLTLSNPDANADKNYYPRDVVHNATGGALTGTAGGDRIMPLISGKLELVIASGGSVKKGGCHVYIVEDKN